ncbi:MAG: ABC transporter substrate-binding protein [Spirochaetales bacterium]|jgi:putative aldouronate transport system substrate-binding protein|nr:ABC transporter substrate-binding protein [Spirochaetales bacterium]
MKKVWILIPALLCLGTLMLTSCQKQTAAGVPTLIWYLNGPAPPPADLGENARIMSDYTQEKIGVRFEIRNITIDGGREAVAAALESGAPFDIISSQASNYAEAVPQGVFAGLAAALPVHAPALWDFVPPYLWDAVTVQGEIYAVPAYKDSSGTLFAFIDERYVRKYNIDPAKNTLADFERAFYAMKAGEGPDFFPIIIDVSPASPFPLNLVEYDNLGIGVGFGDMIGVRIGDENRRVVSVFEEPEMRERFRTFRRWYQDGIISPVNPGAAQIIRGMPVVYDFAWPSKAQVLEAQREVERYIAIPLNTPVITTGMIRGSLLCLSANSKHQAEALKLIELINTDHKFRDMLAYGIEGKHFEYVSYNVVHRLSDAYPAYEWAQGTFFNLSTTDNQPPDTWEEVRKQNEAAIPSVVLGFSMDISGLRSEFEGCLPIYARYAEEIKIGAVDPDEAIPRFMAELRAAGFGRIIAEAQRQVNAAYPK